MPRTIAEYLLHLASHPEAHDPHKRSVGAAKEAMTAFGLDDAQQAAMLSGDPKKIEDKVQHELSSTPAPAGGSPVQVPMQVHFPPGP
jgi:hypothetical protein